MYRSDICIEEVSDRVLGKLYAAFMDLEKAYDRVDREALWSVLYIYGVGGQLFMGILEFCIEKCMCRGGRGVQ